MGDDRKAGWRGLQTISLEYLVVEGVPGFSSAETRERFAGMAHEMWLSLIRMTDAENERRVARGLVDVVELSNGMIFSGHIEDGDAVFLWQDGDRMMELFQRSKAVALDGELRWAAVPLTVKRLRHFWLPLVAVFTTPTHYAEPSNVETVVSAPKWLARQMLMNLPYPYSDEPIPQALFDWSPEGIGGDE